MSDTMTDFDPFADLSDDELDAMIEAGEFARCVKRTRPQLHTFSSNVSVEEYLCPTP